MSFSRREVLKLLGAGTVGLVLPGMAGCRSGGASAAGTGPEIGGWRQFSGVYPHLAFYNEHNECGTGAVVPWAGRLWVVTYAPHEPYGGTDKLYEITDSLERTIRPESIGGTPANRMIHRESGQLFIGPYAIDRERRVRAIPYSVMPGRPTGTARHLSDPANKVYYATMEEGFYEVDVHTLAVTTIHADGNVVAAGGQNIGGQLLPGYHGKGFYTGQGRVVYANNGERSPEALLRPDIASGALAEWDGEEWKVVRRNQFTEVTGPGGIQGAESHEQPVWSYGWDHRSALFMLLDGGQWRSFRMPKASHTYDGAHGWHTEWPRIREIGGGRMLMTMHGMFWDFPRGFSAADHTGIRPLSTYLKIIGDFAEWNGRLVIGSDDSAKSEFAANPILSQGTLVGQSNSNLWFIDPAQLTTFGAPIGRGGPWVNDPVAAGEASDPFLFAGFERRMVHIRHDAARPVTFALESGDGRGAWRPLTRVTVPAGGYAYHLFDGGAAGEWIRATPDAAARVTLFYQLSDPDRRPEATAALFQPLARPGRAMTTGVLRSAGENRGTLEFAAREVTPAGEVRELGYYEIGPDMRLRRAESPAAYREMIDAAAPKELPYRVESASVVVTDLEGRRWRLPRGSEAMRELTRLVPTRTLREVATERALLNVQGHLYELPRANSGGFAKVRPVATSEVPLMELASWRGMLVLAGVATDAPADEHVVRSDDGRCALWFGVVDDLWKLGKARGEGGPWLDTTVRAGVPSDPYLMTGYDRKRLTLAHSSRTAVRFAVEVDLTGDGDWATYREITVAPGESAVHDFPEGYNAYWVRVTPAADTTATAQLRYS